MKNRLSHRNQLARQLVAWGDRLGVYVDEQYIAPSTKMRDRNRFFFWRLIRGVAMDGRAIVLYPILNRLDPVPLLVSRLMMLYAKRGAIVGCVLDIGDCWDVVYDNPLEYKRKVRTFSYRFWYNKRKKKDSHGKEEE